MRRAVACVDFRFPLPYVAYHSTWHEHVIKSAPFCDDDKAFVYTTLFACVRSWFGKHKTSGAQHEGFQSARLASWRYVASIHLLAKCAQQKRKTRTKKHRTRERKTCRLCSRPWPWSISAQRAWRIPPLNSATTPLYSWWKTTGSTRLVQVVVKSRLRENLKTDIA